jgi:hypothetical protein
MNRDRKGSGGSTGPGSGGLTPGIESATMTGAASRAAVLVRALASDPALFPIRGELAMGLPCTPQPDRSPML